MLSQACALAQTRHGLQFTHTPSVDVYVGQANMSCLASPNSCVLHVFEDATSEAQTSLCIGIFSPGYSVCIHQVKKYM